MRVPQVSERIKEAPAQALRGVFAGIGQLLLITDKIKNKAPADRDVPRARAPQAAKTVTDTTVTSPTDQAAPAADAESAPAAATETATAEAAATEAAAAEAAPAKAAATRRPAAKPATPKPAAKPATPKPAAKPATARPAAKAAATTRHPAAEPAGAEPAGQAPKRSKPQSSRDLDKTGNVRLLGDEAGGSAPAADPVSAAADAAPPLPNYDELSVASLRARLRNLDVAQVRRLADYERAHAARDDVLVMFERRIAKLEAQPSEAQPSEAQPSEAQPSEAQPSEAGA
jgi:hypothetical protein